DERDEDGDGYKICGDQDCDDNDAAVGPDGDTDSDGTVDCYDIDDDADGLSDAGELARQSGWVTDPENPDTDGDGVDDGDDVLPLHDVCSSELFFYDDFSTNPAGSGWDETGGYWIWDDLAETYVEDTNGFGLTWVPDFKALDD